MRPNLSKSSGCTALEQLAELELLLRLDVGAEAERGLPDAALDDLIEPDERAAADEEDVGRVDLQEVLLRVLASALRRNVGDGALDDLQERLLHALARDVARDAGVVALAADLVDLVDVDDAALRSLDVVVGVLEELDDDVLDVLADVAGLGERRRVGDGERNVENLGERLGEERLAAARRAQEQDVRLGELDVVGRDARVDALVVVVHRDREDLLRALLPDDVLVEDRLDFARLGDRRRAGVRLVLLDLLRDDVVAEPDALVADVDRRASDELLHFLLRFSAERAAQIAALVVVSSSLHFVTLKPVPLSARIVFLGTSLVPLPRYRKLTAGGAKLAVAVRGPCPADGGLPHHRKLASRPMPTEPRRKTSSMRPYSLACAPDR